MRTDYFYPRSPCGERPCCFRLSNACMSISIHALLAESDLSSADALPANFLFLSTLSLRRATPQPPPNSRRLTNFYPRSPCGERPCPPAVAAVGATISIHALLAESDWGGVALRCSPAISIHALLAESDGHQGQFRFSRPYFYPRSPCGERQGPRGVPGDLERFLSTLSLRRATAG